MRERAGVEDPVVEHAISHGWLVRKVKWIGRNAAPDRLFIKDGKVIFVEFKAPGEEPEPLQAREHKRMRRYGATVYVIDDPDDGKALFA